jgi:hypothetical protein
MLEQWSAAMSVASERFGALPLRCYYEYEDGEDMTEDETALLAHALLSLNDILTVLVHWRDNIVAGPGRRAADVFAAFIQVVRASIHRFLDEDVRNGANNEALVTPFWAWRLQVGEMIVDGEIFATFQPQMRQLELGARPRETCR